MASNAADGALCYWRQRGILTEGQMFELRRWREEDSPGPEGGAAAVAYDVCVAKRGCGATAQRRDVPLCLVPVFVVAELHRRRLAHMGLPC